MFLDHDETLKFNHPRIRIVAASSVTIAAKPSGILLLTDYSGSLSEHSHLLGDLGGKHSEWAVKGFTFDVDYNQYFHFESHQDQG